MRFCKFCNDTTPENFYTTLRRNVCKKCIIDASQNTYKKGVERDTQMKLQRGKCSICNLVVEADKVHHFEWNHIIPNDKSHVVSKLKFRIDDIYHKEVEKCELLCLFCHADTTKQQYSDGIFAKPYSKKH